MTATGTADDGPRHFLDLSAVGGESLRAILDHARRRKAATRDGTADRPLAGKTLAMIFEKRSTRTRVSFDVGMRQMGGETVVLCGEEMHLARAETVADTARVLSRYVDAIMIRTTGHSRLLDIAASASVPVINGLTDDTHPCQIMADVMTLEERLGAVAGRTLAWVGDGNNVLHSLIEGAARFGYALAVAVPEGFEPDSRYIEWARRNGGKVALCADPQEAVGGCDCVITDTWVSMGREPDARASQAFRPYRVDVELMAKAAPHALFMHCLPAHRGREVTDEVMDGPQSAVFDEAENRLHVQKAILAWCFGKL